MEFVGIKSQYVKRQCLARNLPEEVNQQMKGLLRKSKDEAGATPYLDLKKALLLQFGQSAEDAFEKALGLVVTSTPSALAKKMCDYICKNNPPMQGCCCERTISGMWRRQLPPTVRDAIADLEMDTAAKFLSYYEES